jgi:hypothetical protein
LDLSDDGLGVFDPEQFGTALLGFGKLEMHGSVKTPTFVRLASEPIAGDTNLTLSQPVAGWRAGDKLILPDTRQIPYQKGFAPAGEWEEATVASANGNTIQLASPLIYNHFGYRNENAVTEFYPHVGNLSRNIIIRSENPPGTRGHTLFTHQADVDISYVWFKDLGRTTISPLDSTTFTNGQVTHIGTNQIGRYPLHLHHLMGPFNPDNTGYQYTLVGNTVAGGLKWGLTIHNTHYGLVSQNIIYDTNGAGVMTEQGNESFNIIEKNFVVVTRSTRGSVRGGVANHGA